MVLDVKIDQVIAEKIKVKSLFPFFWDTRYINVLLNSKEVCSLHLCINIYFDPLPYFLFVILLSIRAYFKFKYPISKCFPASGSRRHRHYKSDHTQTCSNTTILYYHESKKSSFDDPPDNSNILDEDENDNIIVSPDQEEKFMKSQHRWKKKIPSSKFGAIIKAKGNYGEEFMATKCRFYCSEKRVNGFFCRSCRR